MSDSSLSTTLRRPAVLIPIAVGALIIIVWLVVFFLPQGSKLSKLNAQEQTLLNQQAALNARLAQLEKLTNSNLCQLHGQYTALIPPTLDNTAYLKQINTAVSLAGLQLVSITPGTQVPPASGTPAAAGAVTPVAVSLETKGTYDDQLALINALYALPRLTVITGLTLAGGGPGTTRSTALSVSYTLQIYDTAQPASTAASPTTTTTCG